MRKPHASLINWLLVGALPTPATKVVQVGSTPTSATKYVGASHGGAVVPRIPGSTVKGINSVRAGSIPVFGIPLLPCVVKAINCLFGLSEAVFCN